jgi:hypothetical protein
VLGQQVLLPQSTYGEYGHVWAQAVRAGSKRRRVKIASDHLNIVVIVDLARVSDAGGTAGSALAPVPSTRRERIHNRITNDERSSYRKGEDARSNACRGAHRDEPWRIRERRLD